MTSRRNGTLFTHNNAAYLAPALMPGYGGHVPNNKFTYGESYGNVTSRTFQEERLSSMTSSASTSLSGGMFPTTRPVDGHLTTVLPASTRQQELQSFAQLTQRHRDCYRDRTGMCPRVGYFQLPVKESQKPTQNAIDLSVLGSAMEERVRSYQTLPSGIRTSSDDRVTRDVFFERR
ncbi:ciliary microtubule inner protein 2C [Engraulis encrasicolus]|uniref:ciliary microtubule inner protein 2C n=1 Tax=Engraulis encrasicolus TaxID=184585 RepID=UPI002FD781F0